MIMFISDKFEIIAVTARLLCPRPLWKQIPYIRDAGITRVILREKDLSPDDYTILAERVLRACTEYDMQLTIHNFPETARALGISSLHMPLPLLTESICYEFKTVGTSVHSAEQLRLAESLSADYVTAGHIYVTDCKKGLAPRGTAFLRDLCSRTELPVYAIGGITAEKISELRQTGAAGGCIMSSAMQLSQEFSIF